MHCTSSTLTVIHHPQNIVLIIGTFSYPIMLSDTQKQAVDHYILSIIDFIKIVSPDKGENWHDTKEMGFREMQWKMSIPDKEIEKNSEDPKPYHH